MHIVFHTNEYPGEGRSHGGVGTFVKHTAHQLVRRGIHVTVIGLNHTFRDVHEQDGEINVFRLGISRWKAGKFLDHTRRILHKLDEIHRRHPIDIVEGSELTFAFYPRKTPFKKVIRLHGGHHFFAYELHRKPARWRSFQEKRSFRNADAYIAVSDYVGRRTQKYLGMKFPYRVIYNTINFEDFPDPDEREVLPGRLLFVGTLCEKKGIKQLVQAMPEVVRQFPQVELHVIGRDWYFPGGRSYKEHIRSIIDKSVEKNIVFRGVMPHEKVLEEIAQADICVYPSHMEAMPLSWIEALGLGKPFIGGDIGPGYELVEPGKTGLLADPRNPDDIAEKIVWMLNHPEEARLMGQNARKTMLEKFNPGRIIEQNIRTFNSIVNT